MLSALLLSAAIACNIDLATHNGALELLVRVETSRFIAFNPTDRPELIVFSDATRGTRAEVVLAAYEEVEYRFLTRAIEGLEFEVVASDENGNDLVRSGCMSLESLRDHASEGVWIESSHGHAHAWSHHVVSWLAVDISAANASNGPHSLCSPPLVLPVAPHVQVITPNADQQGDLPPELEKPLPPV
jgi:hypothetical protein